MSANREPTTCQACGEALRRRVRCHRCGAVVYHLDESLTWTLGTVVSVIEAPAHLDLVVSLTGGVQLEARAGPDCQRRASGPPEEGTQVELLGQRREVFDEQRGGPREAPAHRTVMQLKVLAWGPKAEALMVQAIEALDARPTRPPSHAPVPWPDGLIVQASADRAGPPRLRLQVRPAPLDLLPFSLLLPVPFFLLFSWHFWSAARVVVGAAVPLVTLLVIFCISLRNRVITLGEDGLSVQYGHLPWPRRRVATLDDIRAIYASPEGDRPGVVVQTLDRELRWLLPAQPDPARAVLVARLLEQVLGMPPRQGLFKEEVRPELSGSLPDLEQVLRPARPVGDPLQEQGPRARMKVAYFDRSTPEGAEATRRGKVLTISVKDSGVPMRLFFALMFGAFWLLFSRHRLLSPMLLPVHLVALVAVLLPIYGLVVALTNRTTFLVSHSTFVMIRGPLPWPGRLSCHRQDIIGLEDDSDTVGRGGSIYHLDAVLRGGQRVRLINGSSDRERTYWLQQALEQELGLGEE